MSQPLVSVIVPTRNSADFLPACLQSIQNQTYPHIELIVVDNYSTDATTTIARQFTPHVFTLGPERSAQTNFGVTKATGEYVYKVDSDFTLDPRVVTDCVAKAAEGFDAVVVHNSPDTNVSWIARIRKFEVDMYKYDLTHSSARFVTKKAYEQIGGFNETMTAGEDYDFQNKLKRACFSTGFIAAEAIHHGEPKSFWRHMRKFYDYGRDFVRYQSANHAESKDQLRFGRSVYFRHWQHFLSHPIMSIEFFLYNFSKYVFGGAGFAVGLTKERVANAK
jgi:glycosyltransferase involved in cell wall biosynthesis